MFTYGMRRVIICQEKVNLLMVCPS